MSLESFVKGGPPMVWCEGATRDFIMRIRTEPLKVSGSKPLIHKELCCIQPSSNVACNSASCEFEAILFGD